MSLDVLILPRHSAGAASCRHRFLQYLPALAEQGVRCDVVPFFDDRYTSAVLRAGNKQWWRYGASLWRRIKTVAGAGRYDLVVVHAEFVPFAPFFLERWLASMATPYVLDFDDAFFHAYDKHRSGVVRAMFGNKIAALMRSAALNVAGSDYLADYARRFSDRVAVVPTVVDLARFPDSRQEPSPTFSIGWIGSPATTEHLQLILGELREFCAGKTVEILAIGARRFDPEGLPIRFVDWSEATEVETLNRAHVGIMPLPDNPFARGKCGFKLIQAMACWRPVVASPVGANQVIVEHGVTGLHARRGEWKAMLDRLYHDADTALALGAAGRHRVEAHYSLQAWAPKLLGLWNEAARG